MLLTLQYLDLLQMFLYPTLSRKQTFWRLKKINIKVLWIDQLPL